MTISIVRLTLLPSVAFEHRQDLPAVPAVYFVFNAQREPVYIGETANLQARWAGKNHHRASQMRAGGYRIHWHCMDIDAVGRKAAEQEAINYYQPLWNRSEIPGDEMKEVGLYIRNVARYMGIDPQDLHQQILKEWAYSRKIGGE